MNTPTYTIYTDGACRHNADPLLAQGGWGAVLINPKGFRREIAGPLDEDTTHTNVRAEMTAVIKALEQLKVPSTVQLYSDSKLVIDGCSLWLQGWKATNWIKKDKKAPENLDLWKLLDELLQIHQVSFVWIKGHSGHPENERADQLAQAGVQGKRIKRTFEPVLSAPDTLLKPVSLY